MLTHSHKALRARVPVLFEPPPPSVLDARGHDRLLEKLRHVYGEDGRADIAPELKAVKRPRVYEETVTQ